MTLPVESSRLPVAGSPNRATGSGNRQPATGNRQPATGNQQPATGNQLPTGNLLSRFTKVVAFSTLLLIFAGAMVTSTGSGLAVPDWPLSYGMVMPPMVGGIFYEHGHRMIAATVGFLILVQALALQFFEPKKYVRKLGWASLGCV